MQSHGNISTLTALRQLITGRLSVEQEAEEENMQKFPGEIQQDKSTDNPATRVHSHQHSEAQSADFLFTLFKKL